MTDQTPTRTYTPTHYAIREGAVRAARRLHDRGRAATVVGPIDGQFAAIDLDRTVVEVKEALFDLGLGSDAAKTEAWRLIRRGY